MVFKLGNFKAVETRGRSGLSHFAPMDEQVWREFDGRDEDLYRHAENVRTELYSRFNDREASEIEDLAKRLANGGHLPTERLSQILVRQKTAALRSAVLSNYGGKCAFCDMDIPELLTAAHIHRWTDDEENRYNLSNTLCMCLLHHSAFDNGFLTVNSSGKIVSSPRLRESPSRTVLSQLVELDGKPVRMPLSYPPRETFLEDHREKIFKHS